MIRLLGFIAFLSVIYSIYGIAVSERDKNVSVATSNEIRKEHSSGDAVGNVVATAEANTTASGKKSPVPLSKRPKVILFTGLQWCPPCQRLERYVISSMEWRNLSRDEVAFQKVNVPRDSNLLRKSDAELLSKFGIRSYPTMVVVDSGGRELGRRVGASSSPMEIANWVRSVSGNP